MYFAWAAAASQRHRAGLVLFVLTFGGLALARLVSIALAGVPSGLVLGMHGLEAVAAGAGLWCLRQDRPES